MQRHVPAVIDPGRMGDAQLAEHLAGKMEQGEGRRIARRRRSSGQSLISASLALSRPILLKPHRTAAMKASTCASTRPQARLDRRNRRRRRPCRARRGARRRARQVGRASPQLLKSLGAMDADTRAAEAPKIHALREAVTEAIAERRRRRSRMPSSSGGWRPSGSTCRCPRRSARGARSTRSAR